VRAKVLGRNVRCKGCQSAFVVNWSPPASE
jgi:hypothetical protein